MSQPIISILVPFVVSGTSEIAVVCRASDLHDRQFMDEIADKVFEFSDKKLFSWKGNYSAYEVQKKEAFVRESAAYKNQQKEINEIKDFVSRFRNVSSKSAQAQSRLKALEKMEILKKRSRRANRIPSASLSP